MHEDTLMIVIQRTTQVKEEYKKLESRIAYLNAVTHVYVKKDDIAPDLKLRLMNLA